MQAQLTKQEAMEEITRGLIEFYSPIRVYLFGSETRGEAGPGEKLPAGHRSVRREVAL